MTFGEYWPNWIEHKRLFVRDSSIAAYSTRWRMHLAGYFSDIDMDSLKNSTMQGYIDSRAKDGARAGAIRSEMGVILALLKDYAAANDTAARTFVLRYPKPFVVEDGVTTFQINECRKIFSAAKSSTDPRVIGIALALSTGMRIGELCGLRLSDFNHRTKTLRIQRTVGRSTGNGKYVHAPKTMSSDRTVIVAPWISQAVRAISKKRPKDAYLIPGAGNGELDFYDPSSFRKWYGHFLNHLLIPYRRPHAMRHTFATLLLQHTDIKTVSVMLGHANVATTMGVYAHTGDSTRKLAAEKIFREFNI